MIFIGTLVTNKLLKSVMVRIYDSQKEKQSVSFALQSSSSSLSQQHSLSSLQYPPFPQSFNNTKSNQNYYSSLQPSQQSKQTPQPSQHSLQYPPFPSSININQNKTLYSQPNINQNSQQQLQQNNQTRLQSFQSALILIKLWARRRGIYGSIFSYLGGISWSIMMTYICLHQSKDVLPSQIIEQFFRIFSQWNWNTEHVMLEGVISLQNNVMPVQERTSIQMIQNVALNKKKKKQFKINQQSQSYNQQHSQQLSPQQYSPIRKVYNQRQSFHHSPQMNYNQRNNRSSIYNAFEEALRYRNSFDIMHIYAPESPFPSTNTSHNIIPSSLTLIQFELIRAERIMCNKEQYGNREYQYKEQILEKENEKDMDDKQENLFGEQNNFALNEYTQRLQKLCRTTPFFSNYETFIRIDFSSEFEQDLKKWMGFGESKLRSLTIYLESLPNVDVACPLPHPFLHSKKKVIPFISLNTKNIGNKSIGFGNRKENVKENNDNLQENIEIKNSSGIDADDGYIKVEKLEDQDKNQFQNQNNQNQFKRRRLNDDIELSDNKEDIEIRQQQASQPSKDSENNNISSYQIVGEGDEILEQEQNEFTETQTYINIFYATFFIGLNQKWSIDDDDDDEDNYSNMIPVDKQDLKLAAIYWLDEVGSWNERNKGMKLDVKLVSDLNELTSFIPQEDIGLFGNALNNDKNNKKNRKSNGKSRLIINKIIHSQSQTDNENDESLSVQSSQSSSNKKGNSMKKIKKKKKKEKQESKRKKKKRSQSKLIEIDLENMNNEQIDNDEIESKQEQLMNIKKTIQIDDDEKDDQEDEEIQFIDKDIFESITKGKKVKRKRYQEEQEEDYQEQSPAHHIKSKQIMNIDVQTDNNNNIEKNENDEQQQPIQQADNISSKQSINDNINPNNIPSFYLLDAILGWDE